MRSVSLTIAALFVAACEPIPPSASAPTDTTAVELARSGLIVTDAGRGALIAFGTPAATVQTRLSRSMGVPGARRPARNCANPSVTELALTDLTLVLLDGEFIGWRTDAENGPRTNLDIGVGSSQAELAAAYGAQAAGPSGAFSADGFSGTLSQGRIATLSAGQLCVD